jgi:hypothetical protein
VTYATDDQPWDVAIVDLDGDGKLDLAVAQDGAASNLSVLLNNGDGTFAPRVSYAAGGHAHSLAAGDVDGDGDPDVVVAAETDDAFSVFSNDGHGVLTRQPAVAAGGIRPGALALGDLDGDGKLDVVGSSSKIGVMAVAVFWGNGAGGFGAANLVSWNGPTGSEGTNRPWRVVPADLDGDGRLDLAIAAGNDVATVLLNSCAP